MPRHRLNYTPKGRSSVVQAKLVLLVMINLAQLWILSATIEASMAREYSQIYPLVVASAVCWLISLTIVVWWKPVHSKRAIVKNVHF